MAAPTVHHTYRAIVRDVTDGDTVAVDVDCGFHVWIRMSCRLLGVDAPERGTAAGKLAKAYLVALLPRGQQLLVESVRVDKYGGRFDAHAWTADGVNVGEAMVTAGHAKPWKAGAPKPF